MIYEATLEITNKCPRNCLHCSSRANEGTKQELDIEKIKLVLEKYEPKWINVSGGEPCERKELTEIIKIAKEKLIKVRLYTTKFYEGFKDIDEIAVSCYSYKDNINQIITQSNYKPFDVIKQYLDNSYVPLVHIVPMSINIKDIEETCNKLINLGIKKIKILKLVNQGRCIENQYLLPTDEELKKLYNILKENPIIKFGNPFKCECNAGKSKIVIMSNGNIIPCESYKDGKCKCKKLL